MRHATLYQQLGFQYRRWNVPRVLQQASRVLTVSEFEKGRIAALFPWVDEKLEVVHNGVGSQFSESISADRLKSVKKRLGLPSQYMFFLGNSDPKKNAKNVLLAYAAYVRSAQNPVPLVVADLSPDRIRDFVSDSEASEIIDHIIPTGYIPSADLPAVYAGAELFLYPSLREGFGLPIIESMAAGTPVITSDRSSMPEVAGQAAMLVDPNEPDHITQMIRLLLEDTTLSKYLIDRGRKQAKQFSWTQVASRLKTVYESALAESGELQIAV